MSRLRMKDHHHLDMFADHPLQQIFHVPYGGVDIQFLGFKDLATAERQELLGEGGGAQAGLADQVDFTFRRGTAVMAGFYVDQLFRLAAAEVFCSLSGCMLGIRRKSIFTRASFGTMVFMPGPV